MHQTIEQPIDTVRPGPPEASEDPAPAVGVPAVAPDGAALAQALDRARGDADDAKAKQTEQPSKKNT